jgi:hypothetical protein
MNKLLMKISGRLPCRFIDDGTRRYLERYYIGTLFGWRFYLHRFVGSDPERALHDHPWRKVYSIILSGWYWEETRMGRRKVRWFNALTGDTFHRVVLPIRKETIAAILATPEIPAKSAALNIVPCWTLFFHTAKDVKPWGFWVDYPDSILAAGTVSEGIAVFEPYEYTREGSQKEWWLTAKTGNQMRGEE